MRRKKRIKKMKHHNLYGQLLERPRLRSAFERVKKNKGAPGSDGITIEAFEADVENQLTEVISELRSKAYQPRPIRRVEIPKGSGGKRKLGIPSVRDRVVQENLRNILEKIFEPLFSERSHGFRPGRGCMTALRDFFVQVRDGGICIVDVDIEKCFDAIPHEPLIDEVAKEVADGSVLNLIRIILTSPIRDGYRIVKPRAGTSQGSPVSPLLANIYLAQIDRELENQGTAFCRYADDIRATSRSMKEARAIKDRIDKSLKAIGLSLSPKKTKLTYIDQGATFLGYRLTKFKGRIYAVVPKDVVKRFRKRVKELTRRNSHLKKAERLKELSQYVRGWGEYYKRAGQPKLFYKLDRWIYRRVIAMLAGRWRNWLFVKYPIRYYREQGLPALYRMHKEHFEGPWVPRQGKLFTSKQLRGATSACSA
ncbi:group II intron reverse transcriptase/maturase [Patescibacteria group bacterium]|nr:group II intron reverse transcriptase/maturase [Patescibacteria group bacterium]